MIMECIIRRKDGSTVQMSDKVLRHQVEAGVVETDWAAKADGSNDWLTVAALLNMPGTESCKITSLSNPNLHSTPVIRRYETVGGWLILLCLNLIVIFPLLTFVYLAEAHDNSSHLSAEKANIQTFVEIDMIVSIALMAFSIYAGVGLWRISVGAVRKAKQFLAFLLLYYVVEAFIPFLCGMPSYNLTADMVLAVGLPTIKRLVFAGFWWLYLDNSKRVSGTYES